MTGCVLVAGFHILLEEETVIEVIEVTELPAGWGAGSFLYVKRRCCGFVGHLIFIPFNPEPWNSCVLVSELELLL
jgi:hypothetical protein